MSFVSLVVNMLECLIYLSQAPSFVYVRAMVLLLSSRSRNCFIV